MDYQESLERTLADLEMLMSAFEAEVQIESTTLEHQQFPFQATFQFSPTASFVLEWREGYPTTVPLHASSLRSSSSQEKIRLEAAFMAFRQHAQECLELQMEAGLTCCSGALESWNDYSDISPNITNITSEEDAQKEQSIATDSVQPQNVTDRFYHWISGEPLLDRKSTFQAHICAIQSDEDVRPALLQLLQSSTKLQRATHNMYAWRVCQDSVWKHDNDDDGEDAAGSRLAHLLSIRNEDGVFVVVSRWFGGIHLGSKRFAHITNVARQILDESKGNRS